MNDATCPTCQTLIPPKAPGTPGARRKYCSVPCRDTAYYGAPRGTKPRPSVCRGCSEPLKPSQSRGRAREWCDPNCRNRTLRASGHIVVPEHAKRCAVSFQVCEFCQRTFSAKTRRKVRACRDANCRRLLKNAQQKSFHDRYREEHGKTYGHANYPEQRRLLKLRRDGLLAVGAEDFKDEEIFERDGWVCQLCFELVDKALPWPHLMSKTLDHVMPVVRGGAHTRANTQLAHLTCNVSKKDSMPEVVAHGRSWHEAQAGVAAA